MKLITPSIHRHLCLVTFLVTLALSLLLGGCTSSKVSTNPTASVGQQLIELDKAYNDGIITQKQYDALKKEIIRKNQ